MPECRVPLGISSLPDVDPGKRYDATHLDQLIILLLLDFLCIGFKIVLQVPKGHKSLLDREGRTTNHLVVVMLYRLWDPRSQGVKAADQSCSIFERKLAAVANFA